MGYVNFYLLTTAAAVPGIMLFWLMMRAGLVDQSIGTAGVGQRRRAPSDPDEEVKRLVRDLIVQRQRFAGEVERAGDQPRRGQVWPSASFERGVQRALSKPLRQFCWIVSVVG